MPKVFIVGPGVEYALMYEEEGWQVVSNMLDADLIQFTGGEDVTPEIYGQAKHPETVCNPMRDDREQVIFRLARSKNMPMVGICRGGQFLNVMCGGRMWQHANHHCVEKHDTVDVATGVHYECSSTHHQMMMPGKKAKVIGVAKESTRKESCGPHPDGKVFRVIAPKSDDIEAVFYEEQRVLCFQPHPEFSGYEECREWFFYYLSHHLGLEANP